MDNLYGLLAWRQDIVISTGESIKVYDKKKYQLSFRIIWINPTSPKRKAGITPNGNSGTGRVSFAASTLTLSKRTPEESADPSLVNFSMTGSFDVAVTV
jgi:hypothetical protein